MNERQQRLREPREIPLRDAGLVRVRVAAVMIDGAEHRVRIVFIHERARAVVDGLARDRHVVGVHHAVDEADAHPFRDQRRLALRDRFQHCKRRHLCIARFRVVPRDHVVQQLAHAVVIAARGEVLERSDSHMAAADTREHRAGKHIFAKHLLAGRRQRRAIAWSECPVRASLR